MRLWRIVVRAAATLAAAGLAPMGLAAGVAQAADIARPVVIGFSEDGRYVAFEEYGIQDGSGFPYSSIYVIDVAANDWVDGSPIRVVVNDSELPEDELWALGAAPARERAMAEAAPVLERHGIVPGNTGTTLVYHPFSDLGANPHQATFSIAAAYTTGIPPESNVLRLTERPATSEYCEQFDLGGHVMLTLDLAREAAAPMILQQDERLPDSRVCPSAYRIHSVVAYAFDVADQSQCCGTSYAMLVLVAMAQIGFEGPDWRFMGITSVQPPFN